MVPARRLLIVEDDLYLTLALYRALSHTYKVDTAKSAASGLRKARTLELDLIILDINLPDFSGLKLTKLLREEGIHTPILILSGENGLSNKINLLENGANDYVTKPFSLAELKARIRVLLRQPSYPSRSVLTSGDVELDPRTRVLSRNGNSVTLRKKEFALIECLMRNAGTAISRNYLLDYVWGTRDKLKANSIDVHIKSLRDKIDRGNENQLIKTVHGLGYVFDADKPKARIEKG